MSEHLKKSHKTEEVVVTNNPYFSVIRKPVQTTDGTEQTFYVVHFPRPAVGVVATRGTDVLLIRQYRPIVDEHVWAIPSGGIDEGESAEQAAARELLEETGFTAHSLTPFLHCYASYGCSDQKFEIFLAQDLTDEEHCNFDHAEVLSTKWFTRTELMGLVVRNGVVDNLSLSPLLLFLLSTSCVAGPSLPR